MTMTSAATRQIPPANKLFVHGIRPAIHLTAHDAGTKKNRIARSTALARATVIPMTTIYRHNSQVNPADHISGSAKAIRKTDVYAIRHVRLREINPHMCQLKTVQASSRTIMAAIFVSPLWSKAAPATTRLKSYSRKPLRKQSWLKAIPDQKNRANCQHDKAQTTPAQQRSIRRARRPYDSAFPSFI